VLTAQSNCLYILPKGQSALVSLQMRCLAYPAGLLSFLAVSLTSRDHAMVTANPTALAPIPDELPEG
jgi:hypothetical protein